MHARRTDWYRQIARNLIAVCLLSLSAQAIRASDSPEQQQLRRLTEDVALLKDQVKDLRRELAEERKTSSDARLERLQAELNGVRTEQQLVREQETERAARAVEWESQAAREDLDSAQQFEATSAWMDLSGSRAEELHATQESLRAREADLQSRIARERQSGEQQGRLLELAR